ncbi:hypothetical protein [Rheinheimera baltica]|uniref:hypothetical protein n=1 Tax=Rheinheimera baltica TaxID=67576 RepID=UPI00273E7474|nr:hypothetical protein [Rheinheimera baltica]MDP5191597.1 hypothetical protein [Rheinheimera baltica]
MKFTYTLTGLIHPERADVNVSHTTIEFEGNEGKVGFSIYKSKIAFTYQSNRALNSEGFNKLKLFAEDNVRAVVDSLGFLIGCGYDVEIIQGIDNQHDCHLVYGVEETYLKELNFIEQVPAMELIKIGNSEFGIFIKRCFSDLRLAIRSSKDSPFYCYRAIECLMHYFKVDGIEKKKAWEEFRAMLDISLDDVMYIKDLSDPLRHGNPNEKLNYDRKLLLISTWEMVFKFIKFSKDKLGENAC